jgi:hypothetical protein
MPRAKRETADATQLRNSVGVMFNDADMEMIGRVAARYGMSKSAAVRLLARAGAATHDPSPPTEGATQHDQ